VTCITSFRTPGNLYWHSVSDEVWLLAAGGVLYFPPMGAGIDLNLQYAADFSLLLKVSNTVQPRHGESLYDDLLFSEAWGDSY
jgi:hypothetical protein